MTYALTSEEIKKVRDLIHILTLSADGYDETLAGMTDKQEKQVVELAWDIQRFLKWV